jgi:hypothetical protein
MATQLRLLEEKGYRTFLFGDSDGDRGKDGEPRNESMEAEILQRAERKAGHTWICPENEGNCYTRYNVSRERLKNEPSYDPATATSAIDHASQGGNSVMGNALVSYRLNEDMHLRGTLTRGSNRPRQSRRE